MAKIGFCKGTTAEWKEVESQLILDDGEVGVEVTTAGKYVTRMGNGKDKYFGLPITNSSDQYENLSSLITQATSVTERATKAAENAEKAYNLVKDTSVGDLALKVDDINSNLAQKTSSFYIKTADWTPDQLNLSIGESANLVFNTVFGESVLESRFHGYGRVSRIDNANYVGEFKTASSSGIRPDDLSFAWSAEKGFLISRLNS